METAYTRPGREDAEYLKSFINECLDAWKTGGGDENNPITLDLAVRSIWREVDRVWDGLPIPTDQARYRVTVPPGREQKLNEFVTARATSDPITSLIWLGPRNNGDPAVVYLLAVARTATAAFAMYNSLRDAGFEVRDWRWHKS